MSRAKILAFTPTYGPGPRPEAVASVRAQEWAGELVHEVSQHNPFPAPDRRNLLAQYERGRDLALEGGYDALLTVEHDMQLPADALSALWATGAAVAYGVYLFRHGAGVLNALEYLPGSVNLGQSLSLWQYRLERLLQREVVPVSGVGFGCTLIRREALEAVPFRAGEGEAPDMPFARDLVRAGVAQVAHLGVRCGHWDGARWLWPSEYGQAGEAVAVVANARVTVRVGGESLPLRPGQEYELPAHEARELARAGYVSVRG